MKTQLINLLTRGYPLKVKQKIVQDALEHGDSYAILSHAITPSTLNRILLYKNEILSFTEEEVEKLKRPKRTRSDEYKKRHRERHNPAKKRKKHPFKVIANYANSNYKLVCCRRGIKFEEGDKITPSILFKIAKRQKCKCALSGAKLTADNISVDHIIPVSKGGKNVTENIRLVSSVVNKMRNDMDDLVFINHCKAIASHNVH